MARPNRDDAPDARSWSTNSTLMRVPLIQGLPWRIAGSDSIRLKGDGSMQP